MKKIYRVVKVSGMKFYLIATKEFIKRIKGRHIDFHLADSKIDEALPEIYDIWMALKHPFSGVIKSRKSKINIVFSITPSGVNLNMVLITAMVKIGFSKTSMKDYEVWVNPAIRIVFESKVDEELAGIIKDDVVARRKKLKNGYCYHIENELVNYFVECGDNYFAIPAAEWQKLYLINIS